jgi:hypothetical protein
MSSLVSCGQVYIEERRGQECGDVRASRDINGGVRPVVGDDGKRKPDTWRWYKRTRR